MLLRERFLSDVLSGLRATPKGLPSRWLYDEAGSALFEQITMLPEYEIFRIESAILAAAATSLHAFAAGTTVLVEYGAGSGEKTEHLVRGLVPRLAHYVPLDVVASSFASLVSRYRETYPALAVTPLLVDFTEERALPVLTYPTRRLALMLGSTIGNLKDDLAIALLARMREHMGPGGQALVSVDTTKQPDLLLSAYDDPSGVTARFNLNLLIRINRELAGTFAVDQFRHVARWNEDATAIEMHLESTVAQDVRVAGETFRFDRGETLHTESSYKYDVPTFSALAGHAGWKTARTWSDASERVAIFGLE